MPLIHSKVKHFLIMAIQSKYSNTQVESLIAEILAVLEKHKAPTDLSLMALGNCVTNLLERKVPSESRKTVAEQFAKALAQSVKSQ
ncbi:hypothetical protein SAMN05421840_10889 [Shewanella morhuae]|uniref:UPF0352 protein NCTC10736_01451 n=2 Tax=Shewanella morhuae TaxID=365591 RepID=A0A1N6XZF4_9GAMM|nr:UPF0352 protein [Shewanella morhuae]SIR07599.1 hypothetical protein SAMN05421840_10889 [Shewanella morhuae]SUI72779.1 Uncharacterized protein conserved in bacteria [Shewanella morhuae]